MTPILFIVAAAGIAAPALKEKGDPIATVVGEWVIEQATMGGQPSPDLAGNRWVFNADGTRHVADRATGRSIIEGLYTQDPKTGAVDLNTVKPAQAVHLCRFRVDGDILVLNVGWQKAPRPEALESPANSQCTLYVMRRVKKD